MISIIGSQSSSSTLKLQWPEESTVVVAVCVSNAPCGSVIVSWIVHPGWPVPLMVPLTTPGCPGTGVKVNPARRSREVRLGIVEEDTHERVRRRGDRGNAVLRSRQTQIREMGDSEAPIRGIILATAKTGSARGIESKSHAGRDWN